VVAIRALATLLVLTAGALHLYLWFDYFHRVHVVGALFLTNFACGIAVAVALVFSRSTASVLAGFAYSVGTLAAFAVSTKWGLFGYRESFWGSWQEAAGGVELVAALLLAAVAGSALLSSGRRSPAAEATPSERLDGGAVRRAEPPAGS
jgi:hypothetical protein